MYTEAQCRFGPMLIGVFINMILYGVRRVIYRTVDSPCSSKCLGASSSGRCNRFYAAESSNMIRPGHTIRHIKGARVLALYTASSH